MEIEADSVEGVRRKLAELQLADIARVGTADILSFEVAPREITVSNTYGGDDDDESPDRPRPTGWYLPG